MIGYIYQLKKGMFNYSFFYYNKQRSLIIEDNMVAIFKIKHKLK